MPTKRHCSRCGEPATLLLRKTLPSCTQCAQKAVENRTKTCLEHARGAAILDRLGELDEQRRAFGTTVSQRRPGGMALAFSGGPSSRALLHIATTNIKPPPYSDSDTTTADPSSSSASSSPHQRKSKPVDVTRIDVLYIDDSAVVPGAHDQTEDVRRIVEEQGGRNAGLKFVPLKLEDVFVDDESAECSVGPADVRRLSSHPSQSHDTRRTLLQRLFTTVYPPSTSRASIPSSRSRVEDLHSVLIQRLLAQTARALGDSALLLGDNASRGAINLIDGVAKGRGHKWPIEGAPVMWNDDLLVLRPLRDTLAKEIAFFNQTLALEALTPTDIVSAELLRGTMSTETSQQQRTSSTAISSASTTGALEKASIGRLTENFIYSLEKGVPSTVSTVGRTGSKLVLKEEQQQKESQRAGDVAPHVTPPPRTNISGLGQKGDRLIAAARNLPRWSSATGNACAFCMFPAQPRSSTWKSNLSITGKLHLDEDGKHIGILDHQEESAGPRDDDKIPLHDHLCYSCLHVLDVPEQVSSSTLHLPLYVLYNLRQKLRYQDERRRLDQKSNAQKEDDDDDTAPRMESLSLVSNAQSLSQQQDRHTSATTTTTSSHVTRRVGKEEMKGRVGQFLLDEDEEDGGGDE